MPAWLIPLLMKVILAILQKTGVITSLEADALKVGDKVLKAVDDVKVYSAPDDYPNPPTENNSLQKWKGG